MSKSSGENYDGIIRELIKFWEEKGVREVILIGNRGTIMKDL